MRVAFDGSDRAYLAVAAAWRGAGDRGAALDIEAVVPASTDWFLALGHSAAEFAGVALLDIYLDLEQQAEEFARELVAESPLTWRIVRPSVSMLS